MASFETFKLSELRLDEDNYRTGHVDGQRGAIHAIINNQKQKLVNLAKDILAQGGVSPGEPIWVVRGTGFGSYIVVEGNRRVTVLKLLDNPLLADDTFVEKQMRELSSQFAANPIRELTGVVFASLEDAEPWRRRRHLSSGSGVGLEPWDTLAKSRADRDHGKRSRRVLTVYEYLQDSSDDWRDIAATLDGRWTTVERVLNSAPMKDALGIEIDPKTGTVTFENGNEIAGKKLLRSILGAMAAASFDFAHVEKKEDRQSFLERFSGQSVKTKPTDKPSPTPPSPSPAPPPPPPAPIPRGPKLDITKRTTLAPRTGTRCFLVNGVRLNTIYRECRELTVEKNENAAALLLRVFIELSSEALLTEKKVEIPAKFTPRAVNWEDIGIPLSVKVSCGLAILDPTGKAKAYQPIRVAIDQQSDSIASINTLHGYFHNRAFNPLAGDLMKAWDVWEGYLSALHGAR